MIEKLWKLKIQTIKIKFQYNENNNICDLKYPNIKNLRKSSVRSSSKNNFSNHLFLHLC